MKKLILKLHKLLSCVGFIKKSLFNNIAPTSAKVKPQFINDNTRTTIEKKYEKPSYQIP